MQTHGDRSSCLEGDLQKRAISAITLLRPATRGHTPPSSVKRFLQHSSESRHISFNERVITDMASWRWIQYCSTRNSYLEKGRSSNPCQKWCNDRMALCWKRCGSRCGTLRRGTEVGCKTPRAFSLLCIYGRRLELEDQQLPMEIQTPFQHLQEVLILSSGMISEMRMPERRENQIIYRLRTSAI